MAAVEASGTYEGHAEFTAPEGDSKGKLVSNCRTLRTLGWRPKYGEHCGCCDCRSSCSCSCHSSWLLHSHGGRPSPAGFMVCNLQVGSVHAYAGRAPANSCRCTSRPPHKHCPDALLVSFCRELRGVHGSGRQGLVQRGAGSCCAGQCTRLRHYARAPDVQGSADKRGMADERQTMLAVLRLRANGHYGPAIRAITL